jgi:transposase
VLEYNCERDGTHFVKVEPEGTTEECAQCGVETHKPLWVREHSCPACGFEADRDANAAWNILSRGLTELGVGHSEERLWRPRSLREPPRSLQSASWKQEAPASRNERLRRE